MAHNSSDNKQPLPNQPTELNIKYWGRLRNVGAPESEFAASVHSNCKPVKADAGEKAKTKALKRDLREPQTRRLGWTQKCPNMSGLWEGHQTKAYASAGHPAIPHSPEDRKPHTKRTLLANHFKGGKRVFCSKHPQTAAISTEEAWRLDSTNR